MPMWEYKIVSGCSEDELNRLGRVGWELVAIQHTANYIFKRPVQAKAWPGK